MAKSRIETEGKTADEVEKEKNEIVGTYLPFFMETFAEMENEPEEWFFWIGGVKNGELSRWEF